MGRSRKPLWGRLHPGFESLPLRQHKDHFGIHTFPLSMICFTSHPLLLSSLAIHFLWHFQGKRSAQIMIDVFVCAKDSILSIPLVKESVMVYAMYPPFFNPPSSAPRKWYSIPSRLRRGSRFSRLKIGILLRGKLRTSITDRMSYARRISMKSSSLLLLVPKVNMDFIDLVGI
jgi:hypothetical protein